MESTGDPWLASLVWQWLLLVGGSRLFHCGVVHYVLKFFAGFEVRNLFGGHFHARSGFRIAADARLPLPGAKAAESADLDLVTAAQGLYDTVEDGFDDDLGLFAGHFHYARDLFNQIRLGHLLRLL